jgi:hypothetical protein
MASFWFYFDKMWSIFLKLLVNNIKYMQFYSIYIRFV